MPILANNPRKRNSVIRKVQVPTQEGTRIIDARVPLKRKSPPATDTKPVPKRVQVLRPSPTKFDESPQNQSPEPEQLASKPPQKSAAESPKPVPGPTVKSAQEPKTVEKTAAASASKSGPRNARKSVPTPTPKPSPKPVAAKKTMADEVASSQFEITAIMTGWPMWKPVFDEASERWGVQYGSRAGLKTLLQNDRKFDGTEYWSSTLRGSHGNLKVTFAIEAPAETEIFTLLACTYRDENEALMATRTTIAHDQRTGCGPWRTFYTPMSELNYCCDTLCNDVPEDGPLFRYDIALKFDKMDAAMDDMRARLAEEKETVMAAAGRGTDGGGDGNENEDVVMGLSMQNAALLRKVSELEKEVEKSRGGLDVARGEKRKRDDEEAEETEGREKRARTE